MRRHLLVTALLVLLASPLSAQKQANVWIFGARAGIAFEPLPPTAITNSAMIANEGCASIADPTTGTLLFYTDGITVWNNRDRPMQNGTNIGGHPSASQSALIIPHPGVPGRYFVFTVDSSTATTWRGLSYSVVVPSDNGGSGAVVEKQVSMNQLTTEHLAGVRRCNGRGYWVISHLWKSNQFVAFEVTASGLSTTPVVSAVGPVFDYVPTLPPAERGNNSVGYLKASPDGRRLAVPQSASGTVLLFDFDPETGRVSNPITINNAGQIYGISFSPNDDLLYTSDLDPNSRRINQYNITSSNPAVIEASRYQVAKTGIPGAMQVGPDSKIYIAQWGGAVSVIEQPNIPGKECKYAPTNLNLLLGCRWGLPNFIDAEVLNLPVSCGYPEARFSMSDTTICVGDCITFKDLSSGATAWRWTFVGGTPGGSSSRDPGSVCYQAPGNYTVRLIASNAAGADTFAITVVVLSARFTNITKDTTICAGESVQLQASGATQYKWSPATGLSCTDCPNPVASPTGTTTYTVTTANSEGCRDTARITITVLPQAMANAGPDKAICPGASVQLDGSGGGTYEWRPATGLSCTNCATPIASPATTTTYTLRVNPGGRCTDVDSVTVTVNSAAKADAGPDRAICAGEAVQLEGSGGGTYEWVPATGLSCTDCAIPKASPIQTTTYTLRVRLGAGCTDLDSVTVTVRPTVTATISDNVEICAGDSTKLTASGGTIYRWEPAAGLSCADCPSPIARPVATTNYSVIVNTAGGCPDTAAVTVTVHPIPLADAGKDRTLCIGESTTLTAQGGTAYTWSPDPSLSCTSCQNPIASPTVTTTYHVEVTGSGGCAARDSITVTVVPGAMVTARGRSTICPGDSVRLSAEGHPIVSWSPAEGLSCTDCATPIARPTVTTTYTVTVANTAGCRATDTVTVSVLDASMPVHAHINRDFLFVTPVAQSTPVILDDPLDYFNISTFTATIRYDVSMLRFRNATVDGLTNGWTIAASEPQLGTISAVATAPPGSTLKGIGSLMKLEFIAYLGPVEASELPFELGFSQWPCLTAQTGPGRIMLDSICGLTYRLMAAFGKRYALDKATPNPFNPTATIPFSIGMDGPTRLVVYNALGEEVAVLVDDYLQPGAYQATWNAAEFPDGLYYYRLTSGAWSDTGTMMLRK
jgi:PKD repeat protein